MDGGCFHKKLSELVGEVRAMPEAEKTKLAKLAEETKHRHEQLKKTVTSLQESIDFLRLSIKYLLFDLEATKRENAQLRKMLDERSSS
jgi:predicted RNase H-like nuclease (RuvC/YqgF family)